MNGNNRALLAASLLSKEPEGADDRLNTALFVAAFAELDEMRQALAQIPRDIDKATANFRQAQIAAVDDLVSVSNEALSKFQSRTGEMVQALEGIKAETAGLARPRPAAPPQGMPRPSATPAAPENGRDWISSAAWFVAGAGCMMAVQLVLSLVLKGGGQ